MHFNVEHNWGGNRYEVDITDRLVLAPTSTFDSASRKALQEYQNNPTKKTAQRLENALTESQAKKFEPWEEKKCPHGYPPSACELCAEKNPCQGRPRRPLYPPKLLDNYVDQFLV